MRNVIVIYRNDNSDLNLLFRKDIEFNVPYLETPIGFLSMTLWRQAEDTTFYFPESWKTYLADVEDCKFYKHIEELELPRNEVVIYTGVFLLPHEIDLNLIRQNPEETFALGNILYASTNSRTLLEVIRKKRAPDREFIKFEYIEATNFIQSMLEALPESSVSRENGTVIVGGAAIINTPNIIGCKIFGPCYISEDSYLHNTTVYPGSIIIKSTLVNSETRGSYLNESNLENSELHESIAIHSRIKDLKLVDANIPSGSMLTGRS